MNSRLEFKNRNLFLVLSSLFIAGLLSGCVVRTYSATKDRVDQDLNAGNRGYLKGQSASADTGERKTTRITRVVEIEMRSPIKFEKMSKQTGQQETAAQPATEEAGNRGYISKSGDMDSQEPEIQTGAFERYTVQKNDTLQKISLKFYGTTKKWLKIYEANKDRLKGPDKVYPGQVLNIPSTQEPKIEPKENLK